MGDIFLDKYPNVVAWIESIKKLAGFSDIPGFGRSFGQETGYRVWSQHQVDIVNAWLVFTEMLRPLTKLCRRGLISEAALLISAHPGGADHDTTEPGYVCYLRRYVNEI